MADGFTFDFSDLSHLVADLGEAPDLALDNVRKALEVSARHVKDDWRDLLKGSPTVPAGPASITYDIVGASSAILNRSAMSAEIGPELGRSQGPVVGMLEYGTPTTGPRGYGAAALQKNQDDFERGIQKAGDVL